MLPRVLLQIPVDLDRDTARQLAAHELSKAKYDHSLQERALRILQRVAEQAAAIFDTLAGRTPAAPPSPSAWLALAVLLALFVALVGFLIWRYGLPRLGHRVADMTVGTDASVDPEDYRAAAEAAAQAGLWQRAVLESFRALVREMELRTIIERRPSRTAFETARLVARALPTQQDSLWGASQTFNEVMYGHRAATAADYDVVRSAEQAATAAADEGYVEVSA